MIVDIHNHILWGLDDGAHTPEDTLAMAQMAVSNNITHVIATPHHQDGVYYNPYTNIVARVEEANQYLQQHSVPLTILPGMELHLYGDIIQDFHQADKVLLTLNDTQKYLLIELPRDHVPQYTTQLLFDIQVEGFIPIIAHPERNREIREHMNILHRFIEKGALAQLTAASIAGLFSSDLQKISRKFIEHDLIHFIASDAHNVMKRGFALKQAYDWITKNIGIEQTMFFQNNASMVIEGLDIYVPEPIKNEKRRKKFLGLF